jgi:hypothetical protein
MGYVTFNMHVRFHYTTAAGIKMTASVDPCSLAEADWCFRGEYCNQHQVDYLPDNGGSTHFWDIGLLQRDYTVL